MKNIDMNATGYQPLAAYRLEVVPGGGSRCAPDKAANDAVRGKVEAMLEDADFSEVYRGAWVSQKHGAYATINSTNHDIGVTVTKERGVLLAHGIDKAA